MPNKQYADKRSQSARQLAYDKGTMATPKDGATHFDPTGQRGGKDPGGAMPMRYATADWKMPGGFTTQPRDRSWGMRQCDGVPYDQGLAGPEREGLEGAEDTYVSRGSTGASKSPAKHQ